MRARGLQALACARVRQLLELISREATVGSRLPSEPELSRLLKVSRNVHARHSYLEQDGVILNQRALGTTVIGPKRPPHRPCPRVSTYLPEGNPPAYRFVSLMIRSRAPYRKLGLERGDRE